MAHEETVWSGTPSQVVNLKTFILSGLFCWLVFPLFIILWKWLEVKNTEYELTTQRLKLKQGILSKKTDNLELYRVRDFTIQQPFFLRLFSLGNIVLETSDNSDPVVVIKAVSNPEQLLEAIRINVETCRNAKGVRDIEVS